MRSIKLFALAVAAAVATPAAAMQTTTERAAVEFDAEVSNSAHGELYRAFREHYPREFADFRRQVIALVGSASPQDAYAFGFRYMQNFVTARLNAIASAPSAEAVGIASASLDVVRALRASDVAICAKFGMSGLTENDPVPQTGEVPRRLAALSARMIRAARMGETHGGAPRGNPTPQMVSTWISWIERNDPESHALLANQRLPAASAAQQCAATESLYAALAALPAEEAATVLTFLIRSAQQARAQRQQ